MQMSEIDGETLGQKIKKDPDLAETILILITSIGVRGDVARLQKSGIAGYLNRPVKQSQLYHCLAMAVGMQKEQPNDRPAAIVTSHSIKDEQKRRIKILLAEDNVINQKVALNILEKSGYRADVVANGKDAVRAMGMAPYDLVLMDVQMPEMDGLEATNQIRKNEAQLATRTPIIAMTAHTMQGDRDKCLAAGMDDYISKPVNPQELLEKIEKWISKGEKDADAKNDSPVDHGRFDRKAGTPPIDIEKALARAMGDRAFLNMLIGEFVKNLPEQIEALRFAVDKEDVKALAKQAHALKGASANLSANRISAVAKKLEHMGYSGNLTDVENEIMALEKEVTLFNEHAGRACETG